MSLKLKENNLKYFSAISENKRKDVELRYQESQIDRLQKKMLTRYWKDKINIFDEMIRLNVKTPSYDSERALQEYMDEKGGKAAEKYTCSMGPMNIDSKLLSNRPVSLQRGKKQGGAGIEPVISIEGGDAVCYPNKEARRGRKVGLDVHVLRRMEQCKALEDSITAIHTRDDINARRNVRPTTAPGSGLTFTGRTRRATGKRKSGSRRPETSVARLYPEATLVTEFDKEHGETDTDRAPTVMSSAGQRSTSVNSQRPGTSTKSGGVTFADSPK